MADSDAVKASGPSTSIAKSALLAQPATVVLGLTGA